MKIVCGSAGHTQLVVGLHVDTNASLGGWHSYFVTVLFLSKQGGGVLASGTPHCGATLSNTWQPRGGN